jgi:uncharacterized protein (TIGR02145 family)
MKKITTLCMLLLAVISLMAQVAINEDGSTADASAMLDVKSTSKGFLMPRMTAGQIASVSGPATGLTVFNTDDSRIYIYDDGSGEWKEVAVNTVILVPTVYNATTGETWMDRNLGASQVATSSTDAAAYGDLYQWGRLTDGHEDRGSGTTSTLSGADVPGHSDFIMTTSYPQDWRSPQNTSLWQGVSGTNNPCPSGFRLPTEAEWTAERASWSSDDAAGAFGSPLKLTVAGFRYYTDGLIKQLGIDGDYWSSTLDGQVSRSLNIASGSAGLYSDGRAEGFSIRCIKD